MVTEDMLKREDETTEQELMPMRAIGRQDDGDKILRNGPNTAIRLRFGLPLAQIVLHLSSVALTCTILALCWKNIYFADLTRPALNMRLNAFQFVARFHEFLVAASLGSIVLHHLRYELVTAKGLPYGFIASGFQLSTPQFLFSRSFWRASFTRRYKRRTSVIAMLLFVAATLTALSGPSSAILVVPQVNWWPMKDPFSGTGGLTFLSGTHADLWPPFVNASAVPEGCDPMSIRVDGFCPYALMTDLSFWASDWINNEAEPNMTVRSSTGSSRYLTSSYPKNQTNGYAVATTAMGDQARDLSSLWVYANRHGLEMASAGRPLLSMLLGSGKKVMKPLIQVQCSDPRDISEVDFIDMTFPTDQLAFNPDRGDYPALLISRIDASLWRNRTDVQFNWTELPSKGTRPVLGALVGMTFLNPQDTSYFPDTKSDVVRALMACTMDSRWTPTSISLDPAADNIVILSDPDPASIVSSSAKMKETQDLHIDLSYAALTNAPLEGTTDPSWTVMEYILRWFYVVDGYVDGWWGAKWPWMIATTISLQMADAIARLTHDDSIAVVWHQNPSGGLSGSYTMNLANMNHFGGVIEYPNQDTVSFPDYARSNPDLFTEVVWTIRRFGYAWSFRSVTTYLATTVVVLHIVLVVVHMSVVMTRRWECRSWSTLIEFLTLAFQSPRTTVLEGTSAGIEDSSTYAQRVGIRESEDRRSVVLVAGDAQLDSDSLLKNTKLKAGKKYL
ncbi:hypothetical protein H2200_010657 [Cladophialophora chaetospira]|uniref:Uncharacterized protein n=1 Tax=Cladophialophora chaetospira TaxID=386627 RepID=A0AA38X0I5_9EURO|nr:hypothetical protein H2200_010657 [Cladophialophora chaetospira]